MTLGAMLEPRAVLTVVKDTMETVASKGDLPNMAMLDDFTTTIEGPSEDGRCCSSCENHVGG
eukprot:10765445-Prorocentrum_lima.AAC.1